MHNHKITIENLGPIKKIENFEVRKINLAIGESASGKSLLASAIALFNDEKFLELIPKKKFIIENHYVEAIIDLIKSYFPNYDNYKLKYFYTDKLFIEINVIDIKFLKINKQLSNSFQELINNKQKELKNYHQNIEIQQLKSRLKKIQKRYSKTEELEKILQEMEKENKKNFFTIKNEFNEKLGVLPLIFIPATRSFVSDFDEIRLDGDVEIENRFLENFSYNYRQYLNNFESLNKKYNSIMRGELVKEEDFAERVIFTKNKQNLDISQISSGQKELFPMLLILQEIVERQKKCFIIIEEPEAHLFPKDQKRIFDLIVEAMNKTDSKVFITTHSPYMLMNAGNLMEASKKNYLPLEDKFIKEENLTIHKLENGGSESLVEDEFVDSEYIESVADDICNEYRIILNSDKKSK